MERDGEILDLMTRSSQFVLLGRLFRNLGFANARDGAAEACEIAIGMLEGQGAGTGEIAGMVDSLADALDADETRSAFERTFGHIPAGAFSPYETSYCGPDAFMQSQTLADIAGFYRAFGVEPAAPDGERADHLAMEFEYLALLAHKEALALKDGITDGAEICRAARRRFIEEHAGRWMPVLLAKLEQDAPAEFYRLSAALGRAVLEKEANCLNARCAAFVDGPPPPRGIAEDYSPEQFRCPGASDGDESGMI